MTLSPSAPLDRGRHPAFWRQNDAWREARLAPLSADAAAWVRSGAHAADIVGGYRAGNLAIGAASDALRSVGVAYDADEIDLRAQANARRCQFLTRDQAEAFARTIGARLPVGPTVTAQGIYARLKNRGWWRRQLRAIYGRRAENTYRDLGRVHRKCEPYITNDGLRRHYQQKARGAEFLRAHDVLCTDTGELFPLEEIAAHSLASATVRRNETMVRIRGLEEYAHENGDTWAFFTLTAPSAYHPRLHASGAPNPAYIKSTVRQARDLLQKLWTRVRAAARRRGIKVYGFRVAEPHHDGTPHWHLLLFGTASALDMLWELLQKHWCSVNGEELTGPAAYEARAKRVDPDPAKGHSAAGYIAKYIAKGIDGHSLEADDGHETDLSGVDAAIRVEAWARLHGIRQFQQIGGPRIGPYRELRRIREPIAEPKLESARLAADAGEFAMYMRHAAGIELDKLPGSALPLNAWEEVPVDRVVGIRCAGGHGRLVRVCTRPHRWSRVRRPMALVSLGPVAITVRGTPQRQPGTCINTSLAGDRQQPERAMRRLE